ncbi:MAG: 50S ribosomal protein L24 [Synergistetes bacterium]|nr:MAG: 50S ribosomal protein L24 [bacterium 42_11]MBC7331683.1 50S ribosomal protein L24 [Synergistota bacterium]MDK2872028.1 large subunit ribosomal protein [bacterium]
MHVKKGDKVIVLSGKDKGKEGKVLKVFPKDNKVLVEGINIVKKHLRPTQKTPQGGIVPQEAPIYACKVMVICPACAKPTRVGHAFLEDGRKVRVCKKCGEVIDNI